MKNKTLQAFFKYKVAVLIFIIVGFLMGYFMTEYVVNNNFSYYEIILHAQHHPSTFLTEEYFKDTLDRIDAYNNALEEGKTKISYASINYKDMLKKIKIENLQETGTYRLKIQRRYFPSTIKTSNGQLNKGIDRCEKYMTLILNYDKPKKEVVEFVNTPKVSEVGFYNPYLMGGATSFGMLFISLGFFFIITRGANKKILVDISDNEKIFKTPFHKKYWTYAKNEFSTVKKLCGISITFALMFTCKIFTLPSGFGSLGISLTYLIFSIITMIYGPFCGVLIGFLSDTLGHFIFQAGTPFFFGYTLNAMLSGFMYGLCFYKTKITFAKCLYARLFVNLIVNVVLGSIWWAMVYQLNHEAFQTYFLLIALPKNLLYLLPQSILLYIILRVICRPLAHYGLIDERIGENVSII